MATDTFMASYACFPMCAWVQTVSPVQVTASMHVVGLVSLCRSESNAVCLGTYQSVSS